MDLFLNDLSIHGQFSDISTFREAIKRVMSMRAMARKFEREVYSPRAIHNVPINPTTTLHQAVQRLPRDQKRSVSQWLNRHGPFWEEDARHSSDDYIDYEGEVVTDTALGEAAFCVSVNIERRLISFTPSNWQISPIRVKIYADSEIDVGVPNYWEATEFEAALQEAEPPIASWEQLDRVSRKSFPRLHFSGDCFEYLSGQPFALGAANGILNRLSVLDELEGAVDAGGKRTPEGHRLYQDHFTGDKAWFSDSSETEKQEFEKKLTFKGPDGTPLPCSWHGKVKTPQIRIHFSWAASPGERLWVAYIGLKITRR